LAGVVEISDYKEGILDDKRRWPERCRSRSQAKPRCVCKGKKETTMIQNR